MNHIGILLISTGKYKSFVQDILYEIEEFFMPNCRRNVFIFTDEWQNLQSGIPLYQFTIPSYKFPQATLYRFKCFRDNQRVLKNTDYLFYIDVDMSIRKEITEDLLHPGITVVRHPGFYSNDGWGDSRNSIHSMSYLPIEKRKHYYAGGFNFGDTKSFLKMSETLANDIDKDDSIGIIAEHNDETHLNRYVNTAEDIQIHELTPEYCMVEQIPLRRAWGIDHLEPKIIALAKQHNEIRS